ncbi:MAG: hypothetical protein LBN26_01260 [Christensenellaceae bacterium]|jgi:hypothetical protein|nr:hypothetical protein [Christensenellaceae bacterium]
MEYETAAIPRDGKIVYFGSILQDKGLKQGSVRIAFKATMRKAEKYIGFMFVRKNCTWDSDKCLNLIS